MSAIKVSLLLLLVLIFKLMKLLMERPVGLEMFHQHRYCCANMASH